MVENLQMAARGFVAGVFFMLAMRSFFGLLASRRRRREIETNLKEGENAVKPDAGDVAQYVVCMSEREYERYNSWLEASEGEE